MQGTEFFSLAKPITAICDGTFSQCQGLGAIRIPDMVKEIGAGAFNKITIPHSVESIGERAFCHCNELISIKISWSKSPWE